MTIGGLEVKGVSVGGLKASGCWVGGAKAWPTEQPAPVIEDWVCFEALSANSTVAMTGSARNLEYSLDGAQWQYFTVGSTTVSLPNAGDKVYMKASSANSQLDGTKFVLGGAVKVSGNMQWLLDPTGESLSAGSAAFKQLFYGCSALKDASGLELPATNIGPSSYY